MYGNYAQLREGGRPGWDIFAFILTKTKLNDNTQSGKQVSIKDINTGIFCSVSKNIQIVQR